MAEETTIAPSEFDPDYADLDAASGGAGLERLSADLAITAHEKSARGIAG